MRRGPIDNLGGAVPLYALGAIFLIPLTIGVVLVSSNADQDGRANQICRDLASMYAQGVDFSRSENRSIAMRVAEGLGMDRGGGVLILSKIRVVNDSDCAQTGGCSNRGRAVVTQRYVLGNAGLRASSFGTPARLDMSTGNVQDWANDTSARAEEFSTKLRPGEFTYAAECYLVTGEPGAGVYSRVMY
ncbi:MAG TPA: hypothetical protein VKX49_19480 [Bryobacteraceae bacterium]|nr:hypothetical protein [Bryobacteraceae bacterium]